MEIITKLCELIQSEMELSSNQIWIYNQPKKIPVTDGLFVELAYRSSRVIASNVGYDGEGIPGLDEIKSTNVQETYTVEAWSKNKEARERNHEIVWALQSTASQQLQEKYAFKIGVNPSGFVDASQVEGSARLNRYVLTFNTLRRYEKRKTVEYYDDFSQAIPPTIIVNP